MLYILIALLAVAAVVYLIVKKVHAAAAIFFVGVLLLMIAALTGRAEFRSTDITSSGNALYDQLLVVEALLRVVSLESAWPLWCFLVLFPICAILVPMPKPW